MGIFSLLFGYKNNKGLNIDLLERRAPIRCVPEHLKEIAVQRVVGNHAFLEFGEGKTIIFCHGLFGGIFNIDSVAKLLSKKYHFVMPYLPMYDMALNNCTIRNLGNYLATFIAGLKFKEVILIGSSMGGGASLYYTLQNSEKVKGLVLCGSSGLSNIPLSKGYFKRKDFSFVNEATRDIFYDRSIPPLEMITDVFNALQSYEVILRSVRFTKAAQVKMHQELPQIKVPVLLVWGKQDPITPPDAAAEFMKLLPNASLHIIENCGHVPTQEKPSEFETHLFKFLEDLNY